MSVERALRHRADAAKDKLHKMAVNAMILAAQRVVNASPVGNSDLWKVPRKGYVGGRYRANWMFGVGSINTSTVDAPDASGAVSMARVRAGASGMRMGPVAFVSNSLPYAYRIEYGWSTQAPNGVVRAVIADWPDIVAEAWRLA